MLGEKRPLAANIGVARPGSESPADLGVFLESEPPVDVLTCYGRDESEPPVDELTCYGREEEKEGKEVGTLGRTLLKEHGVRVRAGQVGVGGWAEGE